WKTVPDPKQATWLVCKELLQRNKGSRQLFLSVDIRKDQEDQDLELVDFYKKNNVQWASPLECKLRGDVATGSGVERHMFSMVIFKLISGFHIHLGGMSITKLFEGEPDHLIPSISHELLEKDMFTVAGRMIGHSFLHQGPSFPGLSPAVIHVLFDGSEETCPISVADCPDTDVRDVVNALHSEVELKNADSIDELCFSWDLPTPNSKNRKWLSKRILQHVVIEGTREQVNQLRLGLQETGLWPLLTQRKDVIPYIFPRESETYIIPQIVLDCIIWPTSVTVFFDNYQVVEDDVGSDYVDVCRVSSYLKRFIENGMYFKLKSLLKFWTGWEKPTTEMKVEIVNAPFPSASTCFEKLRLPRHYDSYNKFYQDLSACMSTTYSGFGCE
ncbi:hypothetical protein NQD34_005436, partial [Periophthalmus magnuspinnatus]